MEEKSEHKHVIPTDDFISIDELARRLGWKPKTIRNKMAPGGIFKRGVHYSEAPGLPVLFRWSAVLRLYDWTSTLPAESGIENVEIRTPMARGYEAR